MIWNREATNIVRVDELNMSEVDIFNDVAWLFRLSKFFGFNSFEISRPQKGRKYLTRKKLHYQLSVVFQVLVHIYSFFTLRDFLMNQKAVHGFHDLIQVLKVMEIVIHHLFCLVYCAFEKICDKHMQEFWQCRYDIEMDLRKRNITLKRHRFSKRASTIFIFGNVVVTQLLKVVRSYLEGEQVKISILIHIFYHYTNLCYVLLIAQHILSCTAVSDIFEALEEVVIQTYLNHRNNRFGNKKCLLEIAKYHQKVCQIAKKGAQAITIQVLFLFINSFYLFAATSFGATLAIINNVNHIDNIIVEILVVEAFISIVVVVAFAHKRMEKVSDTTY